MLVLGIFILAAGMAVRFNNTPKQMLPIGKETIIERIVNKVRDRTTINPTVVTHNSEIMIYCVEALKARCFIPIEHSVTCETLLDTRGVWKERNIILLGDVIYSNDLMNMIFEVAEHGDKTVVFGDTWEIFAIVFSKSDKEKVIEALNTAINGSAGKLRNFYKAYCGFDMDCEEVERETLEDDVFCYVHDWTVDIDTPDEYDTAIRELVNRNRLD
jgi:choline kinase